MKSVSLTHWGRVTQICVSKLTIISLDNGLSPGRRQAIIWINAGIWLIGPLGTNFSEIFVIGIQTFAFKKMHLKMPSAKWRPFFYWPQYVKTFWTFRTHLEPRQYRTIFCIELLLTVVFAVSAGTIMFITRIIPWQQLYTFFFFTFLILYIPTSYLEFDYRDTIHYK